MKNLNTWTLRNQVFQPLSYTDEDSEARRGSETYQRYELGERRRFLIPILACCSSHRGASSVGSTETGTQASHLRTDCVIGAVQKGADVLQV